MRDYIQLHVNGTPLRVTGDDAFLTLSDFLRQSRRLTGTKVVCAEGDCGACATLIGRPDATSGKLQYSSVCSCIQLMCQLDNTHVITVEGLSENGSLNPIQAAMVKCHGAQCGFCTPGFIVSLHDCLQQDRRVDAESVRRALVGNLCRCTGYDSIVRAALEADRSLLKPIDSLYPVAINPTADEIFIQSASARFYQPTTIGAALKFREENPDTLIISGATDLGVQVNKGLRRLSTVMSTAALSSMRQIKVDATTLTIGAGATLSELQIAAAEHLPELANYLELFGSPLIRNAATLAGNLVNASPIGDMIPPLFVLNATLEIAGRAASRSVNINDFYTGYRKTVLTPCEIVTAVRIPLPKPGEVFKLYKVSKRQDLDISSFAAAIWMRQNADAIEDIRIAYGGVAPTVIRLPKTEAFLRGQPGSREQFEQAANIARDEIAPISDVRGSAEYRRILAGNILLKLWHERAK